jgi:hypothetical protein
MFIGLSDHCDSNTPTESPIMQQALHACAATILGSAARRHFPQSITRIGTGQDTSGYWVVTLEGEHALDVAKAAAPSLKALRNVAKGEPLAVTVVF